MANFSEIEAKCDGLMDLAASEQDVGMKIRLLAVVGQNISYIRKELYDRFMAISSTVERPAHF